MPELPEVETIRQYLDTCLSGCSIERVRLARKDLRFPFPPNFAERLTGSRIIGVRRRAKYLLIVCVKEFCDKKDEQMIWLVHLGMSGRILWLDQNNLDQNNNDGEQSSETGFGIKHRHVCVDMRNDKIGDRIDDKNNNKTGGGVLCYDDARRFGFMDLCNGDVMENDCERLQKLGIEPLSNLFNGDWLWRDVVCVMRNKRNGGSRSIKDILMDQSYVAGLGNIYVTEGLWHARVYPLRAVRDLTLDDCERISRGVRKVLRMAIEAGGSSLKDYRKGDGSMGYFQLKLRAYGRTDAKCLRRGCDGKINKVIIGGRSSYFCSTVIN